MKKPYLNIIAAVLSAALFLTACGGDNVSSPSEPAVSSPADEEPIFTPEVSLPPAAEEEEMDLHKLLYHQVRYYEIGCDGVEMDNSSDGSGQWRALGVFAEEAGIPYGIDSGRQELLALMLREWFGYTPPEGSYFSDVSAGSPRIDLTVYAPVLEDDTATVRVSRVYEGNELLDSVYVFRKVPASDEVMNSAAKALTLDGFLWKYESVTWQDETQNEYEPCFISTADELIALCRRVNRHEEDAVNGHFILANDIDLTNCYWEPMGTRLERDEDWKEIYAAARVHGGFNGIFDGDGHKITGLSLTMDSEWGEVGFFGRIGPEGVVKNLTVEGSVSDLGATPTMNGCVGGFAGVICPGAEVTNCAFNGKVTGYVYTGGFVGKVASIYSANGKNAVIKNCSANVAVTACLNSGGFAGAVFASGIDSCDAMGSFTIEIMGSTVPTVIGGFAGSVTGDIANCRSAVLVDYAIDGANMMGNFIGELAFKETKITNCIVDPDFLHDGWYLVGMKWHSDTDVDIKKEAWLASKQDLI